MTRLLLFAFYIGWTMLFYYNGHDKYFELLTFLMVVHIFFNFKQKDN